MRAWRYTVYHTILSFRSIQYRAKCEPEVTRYVTQFCNVDRYSTVPNAGLKLVWSYAVCRTILSCRSIQYRAKCGPDVTRYITQFYHVDRYSTVPNAGLKLHGMLHNCVNLQIKHVRGFTCFSLATVSLRKSYIFKQFKRRRRKKKSK